MPAATDTAARSRSAQVTAKIPASCANPIRLRGFYQLITPDTGEVLTQAGSPDAPDGIVFVACKDRRSACCAPCSRLYERDAYHLIAAGLRGGKNVPDSVGTHPLVMLTLTAPSFGPVHGNREHGQPCRCGQLHQDDDPIVGNPIDPARYRYAEQVIWNHYAPELWRRTVKAIRRQLATALGIPRSKLPEVARVRFAKVAEFQRRGVVHYHAVIRTDGPATDEAPPTPCTTSMLETIAERAAASVAIALPEPIQRCLPSESRAVLQWGSQRETAGIDSHTCTPAAGYIAKYATKATETATGGTLVKPIRNIRNVDQLAVSEHVRALIRASWELAEQTGDVAFKRWAHQFGYGGHTLTKSHDYSTTFTALRAARNQWRRDGNSEGGAIVRAKLAYAGRGHHSSRARPDR
jgi:hypothetical protein